MRKLFILTALFLCYMPIMACDVIVGAQRSDMYLPLLRDQRVAIMSNHTGMVGNKHTVDLLLENGINVTTIYSPEHGFRGDAKEGALVGNSIDEKTGIPIESLYNGKGNRPDSGSMEKFDILIIDIQDVGTRFYTYYVTMVKLMDACADANKKMIVFDRPNPNGHYVDGPILNMQYKSGVGYLPIPIVHGMTLGELAQMVNGEKWLPNGKQCDLTVIPCKNYTHQTLYKLPIAPSPNLKSMVAIYLYPSLCYFEGTPISVGRGTDKPFMCYGHPNMTNYPFIFAPNSSTQKNRVCYGIDLSEISEKEAANKHIDLSYVIDAYNALHIDNFFFSAFFEKLTGVDYVRKMIIQGKSSDEIRKMWNDDVEKFKKQRKPYLIYKE